MARVDINPKVLDWAIADAGFTNESFASEMTLDIRELQSILGDGTIHLGQLEKMAKKIGRPVFTFFLPKPLEKMLNVQYRASSDRPLQPMERLQLRKASATQDFLRWIYLELGHNLEPLPQFKFSQHPEMAGEEAREYLNLRVDENEGFKWPNQFYHLFREKLSKMRIFVVSARLSESGSKGFSRVDELVPIVGINSSKVWSYNVRNFTLAHELGHIFAHDHSSCCQDSGGTEAEQGSERWCDRFAASFLAPRPAVVKALGKGKGDTLSKARRISNRFFISRQTAFIRLIEMNEATWDEYKRYYNPVLDAPRSIKWRSDTPRPIPIGQSRKLRWRRC